MKKIIKISRNGQHLQDFPLNEENIYKAGRKIDCNIVLEAENGISREHFLIKFADNKWQLESMSRFGDIYVHGEKIEKSELEVGSQWKVGNYEFRLMEVPDELEQNPVELAPEVQEKISDEKTYVAINKEFVILKRLNPETGTEDIYKLQGGPAWIVGRDTSSQIVIRDSKLSRKQFEIRKIKKSYTLLDLESSNGTKLNGKTISNSEPTVLHSGDVISVLHNQITFEIHDASYSDRMDELSKSLPSLYQPPSQDYSISSQVSAAPRVKENNNKNLRLALLAVAAVVIGYQFFPANEPPPAPVNQSVSLKTDPFTQLTPEQKIFVKQTFTLAKSYYLQSKYEFAKGELAKILELAPNDEESKDLMKLSEEAIFVEQQQRVQAERERNKLDQEEKIKIKSAECKLKIKRYVTREDIEKCLGDVIAFNPEHPSFQELWTEIERTQASLAVEQAQKKAVSAEVAKLFAIYNKAKELQKQGRYIAAIETYEKVEGSSLPDPNRLKKNARGQRSEIQRKIASMAKSFVVKAEAAEKNKNLKEAIVNFRKAQEIDTKNENLKEREAALVADLRKEMMVLYQEGILEESFGNVEGFENKDGAKQKWKKIIQRDITDGEYYKKARIKLKKYGAL